MLISQIRGPAGSIAVVARNPGEAGRIVEGASSTYELVRLAIHAGQSLEQVISEHGLGQTVDLEKLASEGGLLSPITHPDPAHLHLTGTGLTHLGSASTRDAMHKKTAEAAEETLTDSMKMFRMGLENGKPKDGQKGV